MKTEATSKKQVGLNMTANIVSYSANILISFVLTPFLINTIGKETYSFYPIANTIVSYMSILTNAMNSVASRFVTVSLVQGDEKKASQYFSSTMLSNIIISAIIAIPLTIIVIFIDKILNVPINAIAAVRALFSLVFASAIVNIIASVLGIATFAKNRIDLRSFRELITAIVRVALFFALYKILPPSIVYVGIVALVVAFINILFQYGYTKVLIPEIKIRRKFISVNKTKELISSSAWNAINSFGNVLLAGMSLVLANIFYGAAASGTYSIVNTVPTFINGIISMLVGVFFPVITYKYAQKDREGLLNEIKTSQALVGSFGCATIATFIVLSQEFFNLWTPGENSQELFLLSFITILPHLVIASTWTLTNVAIVTNKVKTPALITLYCGLLNILLSFLAYKLFYAGLISLPIISSGIQLFWIGIFIPIYIAKCLKVNNHYFLGGIWGGAELSIVLIILELFIKRAVFKSINSWIKLGGLGIVLEIINLIILCFALIGPSKLKNVISEFARRNK